MNNELLQKNAVVTDNIMAGLLDTLDRLSQQNIVIETVQSRETDSNYYDGVNKILQLLENYTTNNSLITSSYIYSDVNDMLIDRDGAKRIDHIYNREKWYAIHKQDPMFYPYILVNDTNSIFVCQPIWSTNGQRTGLFVLDVELQKIRELLESQEVGQRGIFFVMDVSGQTIYCNKRNYNKWNETLSNEYQSDIVQVKVGESQLFEEHGKRIISVVESEHKSWKYALVMEMPDYEEEMGVVRGFLIIPVLVGLLTSLIVAYLISVLTYRPMRKIMNVIQNPQLHWNEQEASKQSNELLYITSNILADTEDIGREDKEISEELEERIRALRQAQFRALQFQIDPHFLYNTLETIKWSAVEEMGLGNKTSKMLTKVARLYRLGLENDDVIVTLKEELEFLKLYIEIVRIRFGDSIQFHWNIDENLSDCNVIKMCLQPIVENAIQHGLRPNNYQGNITVSAYYREERMYICVENDGKNMSQKEIIRLNETLKTGAGFEENKVGLRNVNERIKLIYGSKYGVSVNGSREETADGNVADVQVVLTFPCRKFFRSEETK